MAEPKFEDFLYPFLFALKDKDVPVKEMRQHMIKHFGLTAGDALLSTKNGKTNRLNDRLGWIRQYLRRAGLIEIPHHGIYRITQRGKDYLQAHSDLKIKDLMQIPEYVEFAKGKNGGKVKSEKVEPIIPNEEMTPTDQLENAYQQINDGLAADILDKVLEQSPSFFEHLVLDLLLNMGYGDSTDSSAIVTPYVHDDGVDGIIPQDKLGLDKIYFQAKRYGIGNVIGKPQIQGFVGALEEQKANKGVFITTSSYSKEARSYIGKTTKKIVLIDGEKLARYMIEYNVGVSTCKTYEVKKIDTDYFEE